MTSLRRKEKEIIDPRAVEAVLEKALVGRLGTCFEGEPYVVPLSYVYHKGGIIFHCALEGKKMENITRNPRVCFEVDTGEPIPAETPCGFGFRYESVIIGGRARVLVDPKMRLEALRALTDKYAPGKGDMLTEEELKGFQNLAVVEIIVDEMTGKKSPA